MSNGLKVLVVGDFRFPIYEEALYNAFKHNGLLVDKFCLSNYLKFGSLIQRKISNAQLKLLAGPKIYRINSDLRNKLSREKYDFIFFYRPKVIRSSVFKSILPETILFCYNNDDPFSTLYPKRFWKCFFSSLKYYHHIFYYRNKNKADYQSLGFTNTSLLCSYYINTANFSMGIPKQHDVIFIGHFEDDGRDDYIKFLLDNGVSLKLFGPEWQRSKYYNYFIEKIGEIKPLKEKYNQTINEAKIALVFLSTLNSDTYTRRCFEIPATKTMMLAQYTDDLNSMFEEGKEADYFRSKEELLEKIQYYLANEEKRRQIGQGGYKRLLKDGHEATDRARQIISKYKELNAANSHYL